MVTMAQALIKKPVQTMDNNGGGFTPTNTTSLSPQQSIDASINNAAMINSPIGRVGQAIMPGGFLLGSSANIGMNNNLGRALGVPMEYGIRAGIGGGNALGGFNQVGLNGNDFTTPGGGYVPVTNNVVTRKHDRFGPPRGESDYGDNSGGMGDQSTGSFGGLDGY
tara:strand:- start:9 stop:503 length:495 start_codon:yes stop_codon:yes gene_type:complete